MSHLLRLPLLLTVGCLASVPLFVPLSKLLEKLQDPQQVEIWIIRSHRSLQNASDYPDIFEGHYKKRSFVDLEKYQRKHALALINELNYDDPLIVEMETLWVTVGAIRDQRDAAEKADKFLWENPGTKWTGQWDRKSFQIQIRSPVDKETICLVKPSMLWVQKRGQNNYLISYYRKDTPTDTLWAVGPRNEVVWTEQQYERNQPPRFGERFPELIQRGPVFDDVAIRKLHGYYVVMREENQRLNTSIDRVVRDCQQRIDTLKEEHKLVMDGLVDPTELWSSNLKWSCIVGAVVLLVTALVVCFGFKTYHSNRKKQWEIQRLQKLLSVSKDHQKADEIIAAHQKVTAEIEGVIEGDQPGKDDQPGEAVPVPDRRFSDLMKNSAAVQVVLMDDVVDEIETDGSDEGADDSDHYSQRATLEGSDDEEKC